MFLPIILFCIGLILIVKGGDYFIDSSINIARITHLPEILIGATIVSLATTAPEAIVSITASFKKYTEMSVGNSVGSIICNTGLVLGITTLIKPSNVKGKFIKLKSLMLILYFLIFFIISSDGIINNNNSLLLLSLLLVYIIFDSLVIKHKKAQPVTSDVIYFSKKEYIKIFILFIIGIIGIFIGSNLLINNGIIIAKSIGVPEAVISLTFIALGTSLPELTTALTALRKGYSSLSVGNIIGANILNISLVLGTSGFINDLTITKQNIYLDFPLAFIMITILGLSCIVRGKISRLIGILLFSIYILYLTTLYFFYMV
ncbi:calcium/sodium antiporter [Clostridium sp. D2Q-11]|uniref:Calcium/sodium antiporter n=1 Tax=Anaeromonas frigoriresistens TaxID=2683708 RepID=A0A942UWE3_9FIRM|nr:calcium/sodium antiporter [Anaeromonas frigoriresistens]MBS4536832.1 calcium/sodium antiporter [Anaeromonas frigoriresistens]